MLHTALRLTREFHRMRQADLAADLGISRSYLSEVESGRKTVSIALLDRYAEVFDVPPSTFLLFKDTVVDPADKGRAARAKRLLKFFQWVTHENRDESSEKEADKEKIGAPQKAVHS